MERNPFDFSNYDLQKINFIVRGHHYPMMQYDFDFTNNNFHRPYMDFLNATGVGRSNASPHITMEMFKKYCSVFALDLQADQCNSQHIHAQKTGSVSVDLTFRANLDKNLTVCFLAYHDFCLTFKREDGKPKTVVDKIDSNLLPVEQ